MTVGWIIVFLMELIVKIGELPCDPHHYDFEDYDFEDYDKENDDAENRKD